MEMEIDFFISLEIAITLTLGMPSWPIGLDGAEPINSRVQHGAVSQTAGTRPTFDSLQFMAFHPCCSHPGLVGVDG